MKKCFAAAACALLLAGCGSEPVKTVDATADIKPVVEKMLAAWETLDPAKAAPFYAKDAGLAFFDIAPLKYSGWSEYEAGTKKMLAEFKSLKFTLSPDFKAYKNGSVAWATYTYDSVTAMKSGETVGKQGRVTDLLELRGNAWLIVHEHVSEPLAQPAMPPSAKAKAKPVKAQSARKSRKR
jgi:ketosteroid isomerase-like protein